MNLYDQLRTNWDAGAISSTVTMGDIDGDGELDVVVGLTTSTGSGEIWVLKAETGESLPHFPVRLMNRCPLKRKTNEAKGNRSEAKVEEE